MTTLRIFPMVPTMNVKRVRTPEIWYLIFSMVLVCSSLPQVACSFSEKVKSNEAFQTTFLRERLPGKVGTSYHE
jgi:hypothetical protein